MTSHNGGRTFSLVLACMGAGGPSALLAQDVATGAEQGVLQEVLVTASKRGEQSLLETPMAIQAVTADQLQSQGVVQFADYARQISGLAFSSNGPGDKKIVLRGLDSTGAATTGLYFDDIVITGNNPQDGGGRQPDLRLVDMERVEVLKGPQGTLYGASSMSGTVRMLTNKPDATGMHMAFNTTIGATRGADGADYSYDGMLNMPIVDDSLSVRVVGYQAEQKGFVDNKLLGIEGVNNERVTGGRVALRWLISDAATLDAMYVHQNMSTNGTAWYQPGFGEFVQYTHTRAPWSESLDAYNLALNWGVAGGTVTASVSKMQRDISYDLAATRVLCTLANNPRAICFDFDNPTLRSTLGTAFQPQDRGIISSELRYASDWSGPIQFVGGVFYDKEKNHYHSTVNFLDAQGQRQPQREYINSDRVVDNLVEQQAVFGELNYSITDALTVTGGVRVFEVEVSQRGQNLASRTRPVAEPVVYTNSTEKDATYKGNIQYKFGTGPLVYFTYSEGFRSGGNNEPDLTNNIPLPPYGSDSLKSYEVGAKGRMLGGTLDFDLAAYVMDWEDLQQRISAGIPGSQALMIANVGAARIKGAELGLRARPFRALDLTLGMNLTVLEDVITKAAGVNKEGDRVPHVPELSGSLFTEYGFSTGSWDTVLHAEYQYVGDSYSDFNSTRPVYTRQGDYSLVNLRLNFEHGQYRLGAYVNNVFDELGVVTTSIDARRPLEAIPVRPRAFGLTAAYAF